MHLDGIRPSCRSTHEDNSKELFHYSIVQNIQDHTYKHHYQTVFRCHGIGILVELSESIIF